MYELHASMVQLAKKLFDGREITGTEYLVRVICAELIPFEFASRDLQYYRFFFSG